MSSQNILRGMAGVSLTVRALNQPVYRRVIVKWSRSRDNNNQNYTMGQEGSVLTWSYSGGPNWGKPEKLDPPLEF